VKLVDINDMGIDTERRIKWTKITIGFLSINCKDALQIVLKCISLAMMDIVLLITEGLFCIYGNGKVDSLYFVQVRFIKNMRESIYNYAIYPNRRA